jgi:hypothetical protein
VLEKGAQMPEKSSFRLWKIAGLLYRGKVRRRKAKFQIFMERHIFPWEVPKLNKVLGLYQGNFPVLSGIHIYYFNFGQGLNIMYSRMPMIL